ncbi:RIN4, pathogenic type III effector avirulence factor Avr cleavage site [Dillenia turbinata]|uniref:RIN4, pathogenic type III effector avirulence factor Avr cleavage site n=1 Tax=Dillenia turbinata TaxID=194707 RepID=A0AAN8Z5R9_9MAGN
MGGECILENGWKGVPKFGVWDKKAPEETNYTMVFSQDRSNRKQQKSDIRLLNKGSSQDLNASSPRSLEDNSVVSPCGS